MNTILSEITDDATIPKNSYNFMNFVELNNYNKDDYVGKIILL